MAIRLPEIHTQHSSEPEPVVHQVTLGHLGRLEAQFPDIGTGFQAFRTGGIRYFAFLGWIHRKQAGQEVGRFEDWADELIDFGIGRPGEQPDDDDEDQDPTEADPEP